MRKQDVEVMVTQLRTMWPGELDPRAELVWMTKLAVFDDTDTAVADAFNACLDTCTFRPTWADFTTAYYAARTAQLAPARQQYTAIGPARHDGPNPVTKIKALLTEATAHHNRPKHTFAAGDQVVVDRVPFGGTDPLNGKTGIYVGMSPDNEWLRIDLEGSVRLFKPSQLKAVTT